MYKPKQYAPPITQRTAYERGGNVSEWSGEDIHLKIIHLNQAPENPILKESNNIELVTLREALAFYTYWRKNPNAIGLSDWKLEGIIEWYVEEAFHHFDAYYGYPLTRMQLDNLICETIDKYIYKIDPQEA